MHISKLYLINLRIFRMMIEMLVFLSFQTNVISELMDITKDHNPIGSRMGLIPEPRFVTNILTPTFL